MVAAFEAHAIDPGPVGAAEVDRAPTLTIRFQPGVMARDLRIGKHEIVVLRAADSHRLERSVSVRHAGVDGEQSQRPWQVAIGSTACASRGGSTGKAPFRSHRSPANTRVFHETNLNRADGRQPPSEGELGQPGLHLAAQRLVPPGECRRILGMQSHLVEVRGQTRPDGRDAPIEHRALQTAPDLGRLHPQPEDPGDAPLHDAFQRALESCQHRQPRVFANGRSVSENGRVNQIQT